MTIYLYKNYILILDLKKTGGGGMWVGRVMGKIRPYTYWILYFFFKTQSKCVLS